MWTILRRSGTRRGLGFWHCISSIAEVFHILFPIDPFPRVGIAEEIVSVWAMQVQDRSWKEVQ